MGHVFIATWFVQAVHEVEVKLPLALDEDVAGALRRAGAVEGETHVEEDTYFAHPTRDFARTDEALRLRRTAGRLELTYKGPRQGGPVKSRVEHQVVVDGDPTALLRGLGFTPAAGVRKTRSHWALGDVAIAVDDVEGLGRFLEVEVVADDEVEAARRVEAALRHLGLASRRREAASYLELQARR